MLISSVGYTNATVPSGFCFKSRIENTFKNLFWLKIDWTRKINIFGNICAVISCQRETRTLNRKFYADRLSLGHGVEFFILWLYKKIMDLKLHKDGTTLLAFTAKRQLIDTIHGVWN